MPMTYSFDHGKLNLRLDGELGHHEALDVMEGIAEAVDCCLPKHTVLELSSLSFMDSSGIAVVVQSARRCADVGSTFEVSGAPKTAMRIFAAAGLNRRFKFT